jgi:hypothetical protein
VADRFPFRATIDLNFQLPEANPAEILEHEPESEAGFRKEIILRRRLFIVIRLNQTGSEAQVRTE